MDCCHFPCTELNGHRLYHSLALHSQSGLEYGRYLVPRVWGKVQEVGPTGDVGLEPWEDPVCQVQRVCNTCWIRMKSIKTTLLGKLHTYTYIEAGKSETCTMQSVVCALNFNIPTSMSLEPGKDGHSNSVYSTSWDRVSNWSTSSRTTRLQ